MEADSETLLQTAIENKDEETIHRYYDSIHPDIRNAVLKLATRNKTHFEDVIQAAQLSGYKACASYIMRSRVDSIHHSDVLKLSCRSAINGALDYVRCKRVVRTHRNNYNSNLGQIVQLTDDLTDRRLNEIFDIEDFCLEMRFTKRESRVACLKYLGFSTKDISKKLQLPPPRISEAMRSIKTKISARRKHV